MSEGRKRPDFIFIGPDKSGSTWIHKVLDWHPAIFVARSKELEFFDAYYDRGLEWYLGYFQGVSPEHKAIGEVCHNYLFSVEACERIHAAFPEVRLMVCLRNPVERAFSAYLYMIKQGRVESSFEEAIETIDELIDHGLYARHLGPYVEKFGRDRIFPGVFDDLQRDPAAFAHDMFAFLGVDELDIPEELQGRALAASKPRSMGAARAAKKTALALRHLGFPRVVTYIKSHPLVQKALYREFGNEERPKPRDETVSRLREYFMDDVKQLDAWFGLGLVDRWHLLS